MSARDNLINKINKRIQKIVQNIGVENSEYKNFTNRIESRGLPTVTVYETYNGEEIEIKVISRSREYYKKQSTEQLDKIDSTLQHIDNITSTWKKAKSNIIRAMNDQRKEGEQYTPANPPTIEEIREFVDLRTAIRDWFDENDDLIYELIEATNWADVREHTNREIYDEIEKIQKRKKRKKYTEKKRDRIRANYRARRKKAEAAARKAARQN